MEQIDTKCAETMGKWWVPFIRHWKTDDESWVKDRRATWKYIKNNASEETEPDALELKGLRNFYLHGCSMLEIPPHPEFWEISRRMSVSNRQRLALSPFTESSHYTEFIDAIVENTSAREVCDLVSNPFIYVDKYLKDTGVLEQRATDIYKHILGNGTIFDNKLVSENKEVYEMYDAPFSILSYFDRVSLLLNLDKNRGGDWSHISYYEKLFDYYASHAELAVTTMSRYKERRRKFISRESNWTFNNFKNPLDSRDQSRIELYERAREFIFGDRLPKEMRID